MKHQLISFLRLLALTAALWASHFTPAAAQQGVFCVNCATVVQGGLIIAALNTGFQRLVGAVQGASTAQVTAVNESSVLIAESAAKTAVDLKKEEIRVQAQNVDPCGAIAAAQGTTVQTNRPAGVGRGGGGGGGSGGGGADTPTRGASADMAKVLKIASGDIPAPAPEVTSALAARGACATYVKGGARERSCNGAGFAVSSTSGFPNADVRAETIFDGPQSAADIAVGVNRKLSLKPGETAERTAINAFIRNLETPLDLRDLAPSELNTEPGRNYMALRDSYEARMSLASKPLRDQNSLLTANRNTLPIVQQLLRGADAAFVTAYLNREFPSWSADGISYAQLLDLEVARRYRNPDWHVRMAAADARQLAGEQVLLTAVTNTMLHLNLERQQQQSMIMGSMMGSQVRSELLPQMVAVHKAAKK